MRGLEYGREWCFVNQVEVESDPAGGLIPLRFHRRFLEEMGPMTPIARMATGIELQIGGQPDQVEITVRTNFSDGFCETGVWYWGPYKVIPNARFGGTGETVSVAINLASWRGETACSHPLRLLFPTHCEVSVLDVRATGETLPVEQWEPFDYRALPGAIGLRWLAHGDSITQGANCSVPTLTWVDITARTLGLRASNLAIGGYGKAEPVIARAIAERDDMDLLSLHVGANAGGICEGFLQHLEAMIRKIRVSHPNLPIFVASPVVCLNREGAPRRDIVAIRAAMDNLLRNLAADDPHLHPIHGLDLLGDGNGLTIDGTHLCDFGFMRYAANAARLMRPHLRPRSRPA